MFKTASQDLIFKHFHIKYHLSSLLIVHLPIFVPPHANTGWNLSDRHTRTPPLLTICLPNPSVTSYFVPEKKTKRTKTCEPCRRPTFPRSPINIENNSTLSNQLKITSGLRIHLGTHGRPTNKPRPFDLLFLPFRDFPPDRVPLNGKTHCPRVRPVAPLTPGHIPDATLDRKMGWINWTTNSCQILLPPTLFTEFPLLCVSSVSSSLSTDRIQRFLSVGLFFLFFDVSVHFLALSLERFCVYGQGSCGGGLGVSGAQAISERHGSATTRRQDLAFVVIRSRAHTYTKKTNEKEKKRCSVGRRR